MKFALLIIIGMACFADGMVSSIACAVMGTITVMFVMTKFSEYSQWRVFAAH